MNNFKLKADYLPKQQRKKILLLSDDARMPSGVGVMSKEIIFQTAHHFNWFQVGAAIEHPDKGKIGDLSIEINKYMNIPDADVKIFGNNGYGDPTLIRDIIKYENIDAILHFTDPRQWIWLYNMEHELRQHMPILFYHLWDNLPYPKYNELYYKSCDWIGCISKQSVNIVKNVAGLNHFQNWQVDYIPHGINSNVYFPISEVEHPVDYKRMMEIKNVIFKDLNPEYVVLFNSRNIRRKLPSNIILAFKDFVSSLPEDKRKKAVLLMHTQPIDINGTDLLRVAKDLAPECNIMFSNVRVESRDLNCLYNIADVTINLSNAEGFGLGTAESLMSGTPIIATVTGGLQDQFGFTDENNKLIEFTSDFPSNHSGKYKNHGGWGIPLFPVISSLTGSPPTPYIYDDYASWKEAGIALKTLYDLGRDQRKQMGKTGRDWMLTKESGMSAEEMGNRFINNIDTVFKNWSPKERYSLYSIS